MCAKDTVWLSDLRERDSLASGWQHIMASGMMSAADPASWVISTVLNLHSVLWAQAILPGLTGHSHVAGISTTQLLLWCEVSLRSPNSSAMGIFIKRVSHKKQNKKAFLKVRKRRAEHSRGKKQTAGESACGSKFSCFREAGSSVGNRPRTEQWGAEGEKDRDCDGLQGSISCCVGDSLSFLCLLATKGLLKGITGEQDPRKDLVS